jgi:hypothetical protein
VVNQAAASTYVAPYVQVRHAIHLLYATSPRSRDGVQASVRNVRFDKNGLPLPLEGYGCGCSLCARLRRRNGKR